MAAARRGHGDVRADHRRLLGIAREIVPIEQRLQDSHDVIVGGYLLHVGRLEGQRVVVGRAGVGKVNAAIVTTLLIGEFTPGTVFFTGMEGAAVMQTCRQFSVPCLVVRGITDRSDGQAEASYDQFIAVASANAAALVADIIGGLGK
jgi:nucleoside phosphorylase